MKPFIYVKPLYFILLNALILLLACEAPGNMEENTPRTLISAQDYTSSTSFLIPPKLISLEENEAFTLSFSGQANGAPSNADIVFMMDLTGSMRYALYKFLAEADGIMAGIRQNIPDARFGLVSHHDYYGTFAGCGTTWNNKTGRNNPFHLNVPITQNQDDITDELAQLEIDHGGDPAESYSRVLFELINDDNLQWNDTGRKIVIAFLDNIPHDCNVFSLIGKEYNTGPDPGRDLTSGTMDDIQFIETLENLKEKNISLFPIYNGVNEDHFNLWYKASQLTGGKAIRVNQDGTLMGEGTFANYIKDIVRKHTNYITKVTVKTCDPLYENWIVEVQPDNIENIPAHNSSVNTYDVTLKVPKGTSSGIYIIPLCLTGDGAEYARTEVKVIVTEF